MTKRKVEALAWNVAGGLSNDLLAPRITDFVMEFRPDIAVFSEASTPSKSHIKAQDILHTDYWQIIVPYDDGDLRLDTHDLFMIASKRLFREPKPFRALGGQWSRMFASTVTYDGKFGFVGMHGADRDQFSRDGHDRKRKEQMEAVLRHIGELGVENMVIGGDLNTMSPKRPVAKLLGLAAPFTRLLPMKNPGEKQTKLEHFGSLANRLSYMALGSSIALLEENDFVNADPEMKGTMHSGPIHVDLDHFMGRGVEMDNFAVHPHGGLSDHDAISVTIHY